MLGVCPMLPTLLSTIPHPMASFAMYSASLRLPISVLCASCWWQDIYWKAPQSSKKKKFAFTRQRELTLIANEDCAIQSKASLTNFQTLWQELFFRLFTTKVKMNVHSENFPVFQEFHEQHKFARGLIVLMPRSWVQRDLLTHISALVEINLPLYKWTISGAR